jgi:hypothetical protein
MHKSRAIRAFERRLFELGCPARYSQRSVAEFAEHFEDLVDARIEEGLEPEIAAARASKELGEPTLLAERLVVSFRQASWWGHHPVIGFCLLPPLALMLLLPATVLALYGLFLVGNIFSRHSIPLDEFQAAVATAPVAFAEWDNPLMWLIHSVPIAVNTILFCKLVARSALGVRWLVATCTVCSASGFFTWTGFSFSGFYLGYGTPSVYNWISAAMPLLIGTAILLWRKYRLVSFGPVDSDYLELFHDRHKDEPGIKVERHEAGELEAGGASVPASRICDASGGLHELARGDARPTVLWQAPKNFLKEQWFTPTSAIAAAIVVISVLLVKFVFLHDKADHAKMEDLRNSIWPAERKRVLDFLQIRQTVTETTSVTPISLQEFATASLSEPVCWFARTNLATLSELPRGRHTFAGVPFAISERVQLMGNGYKDLGMAFPTAIKGFPIHQKCRYLHILHGASFLRIKVPSVPDEKGFMPVLPEYETTNSAVARFVLHYADRTQAEIKIFSTKHLLDVWGPICSSEVAMCERSVSSPESELAWASSWIPAEKSEMLNSIRLYKSRLENPRPETEVVTVDYVSTRTDAAPFLLGLTIE